MIQTLVERPAAGGERFTAKIGASPLGRRVTQALLLSALVLFAIGTLLARVGGRGLLLMALGGLLLTLSVAAGVLCGGTETLVLENGLLAYRRVGVLRERRMTFPTADLCRIRNRADGARRFGGILLEGRSKAFTVGRRLSVRDAGDLAWMLRHHLSLHEIAPVTPPWPRPVPAAPARADSREVLRARNLPMR